MGEIRTVSDAMEVASPRVRWIQVPVMDRSWGIRAIRLLLHSVFDRPWIIFEADCLKIT